MLKEKSIKYVLLFDFYSEMLTDKQKEFFDLYYNHDFSLGEIADNEGITRQGVRDSIARAEETLEHLESKLGFYAWYTDCFQGIGRITKAAGEIRSINERSYQDTQIRDCVDLIAVVSEQLTSNQEG